MAMWQQQLSQRRVRRAALFAGFAFVVMGAASAAELPESIARCAEVADNLERLTCYDRQNPPRQAAAPPRLPDASFGVSADLKRKQAAANPTMPREPDRITTKVVRVTEARPGDVQFEFDNGQVWQQTERRLESIAEIGDEITITRGALGSYFLVGKSKLSTRVKRVK
jgi:hypothetical protein